MHKKAGAKVTLASFLIIICFSWLLWIFLEKYTDTTNYEKRKMASQPRLTADNYGTFAEQYENWFNDNIPFRNNLISLNSAIDFFVFDKSSNSRVIKGKGDWLFYNDPSNGDPLGDYQGTTLLSEEELQKLAQNCVSQQDFLEEQGKEFVLFIAPNKERIYSEYMPERYGKPADNYRALQIYNYLKENTDLRVVYPYEELMAAKALGSNIYYKTDTHWNFIGAYVGATALLHELGVEMPNIQSNEITVTQGENTSGDLAGMLNLSKQLRNTDHEYSVEGYDTHQIESVVQDFDTVFSFKATGADPRRIYVIRDSFSTAMAPIIGSQFSETYMRNRKTYSYDDYLAQNPDIVVREVVERHLSELMDFSIQ